MRARFVNESLQGILKPKSQEEIRNNPEFLESSGDKLMQYGLNWNDPDLVSQGLDRSNKTQKLDIKKSKN